MQPSIEISIELTAQELLAPLKPTSFIEVDDNGAVDPLLRTGSFVANADSAGELAPARGCDDSIEIKLTAEEMDALLTVDC